MFCGNVIYCYMLTPININQLWYYHPSSLSTFTSHQPLLDHLVYLNCDCNRHHPPGQSDPTRAVGDTRSSPDHSPSRTHQTIINKKCITYLLKLCCQEVPRIILIKPYENMNYNVNLLQGISEKYLNVIHTYLRKI